MAFSKTSKNIHLEGKTSEILVAECLTLDKTHKLSRFDLNPHLGNINGKFQWGKKDFSLSARNIALDGSKPNLLKAQLKNESGQWVDAEVDLDSRIANNDGVLALVGGKPTEILPPAKKPTETRPVESPPPTPGSRPPSYYSGSTQSSILETASTMTSVSESSFSESYFSSFYGEKKKTVKSYSAQLFRLSCYNLRLREKAILEAECTLIDGETTKICRLNLDEYIGNMDGKLVWGRGAFSKTSEKIAIIEGYILFAMCRNLKGELCASRLDLTRYLQAHNGVLGVKVVQSSAEFSEFFSKAPWMKFRVVTEPDASVIMTSPAIKAAFKSIATSTVEHVSTSLTRMINVAIQEAVKVVAVSAMEHVESSLEIMMESTAVSADIYPAQTRAEHLELKELIRQQTQEIISQQVETQVKELIGKAY